MQGVFRYIDLNFSKHMKKNVFFRGGGGGVANLLRANQPELILGNAVCWLEAVSALSGHLFMFLVALRNVLNDG